MTDIEKSKREDAQDARAIIDRYTGRDSSSTKAAQGEEYVGRHRKED